jgi:peptidoglycan/xylan/chitin deacetylase (PgdA/CDA1 family)
MALLDRFPFKVTFYVTPFGLEKKLEGWRQMAQKGHEIGNHSMTHPCSANFKWSREKGVEEYSLERMEKEEILAANAYLEKALGVRARTYAYPCGHTYVGRGEGSKSYVPLIARHFLAGRGYRNEFLNDPLRCDMAHLSGTECDRLSFEDMRAIMDQAAEEGSWVIFAGHDIGSPARQTTAVEELVKTFIYLKEHSRDFWVQTVADAAEHVQKSRKDR